MINQKKFVVIGGSGNHKLDEEILRWINENKSYSLKFKHIDFETFPDGEDAFNIVEPGEIADKTVLIFQSVYNKNLKEEFLTLVHASKKQYGAREIIAIVPFLLYRRQDHPEKNYEINRNEMFIEQIKNAGADTLVLCDIHSQETLKNCQAVDLKTINVSTTSVFVEQLLPLINEHFYVYSPDKGSIERSIDLAKKLGVKVLISNKTRRPDGEVEINDDNKLLESFTKEYSYDIRISSDEYVKGSTICLFDDEISTGGTAILTGEKLISQGTKQIIFCATHPVCVSGWKRKFIDKSPFDMILLGNTIPRDYPKHTGGKIINVSMAIPIAQALVKIMSKYL